MTPQTEEFHTPTPLLLKPIWKRSAAKIRAKAMFAPEVTLQFPLSPRKIVGRESVIEYVLSMLPGIDDVKLERHMTGATTLRRCGRLKRCGAPC